MIHRTTARRLAGAVFVSAIAFGGAASAEESTLSWSSAAASVGICQVGVTCGQPKGVTFLGREQFTVHDEDFNNASVYPSDYGSYVQNLYFGQAYASAEAGEGLLGLPTLHAVAAAGSPGLGQVPKPFIGVSVGLVQAVQGYTNTSDSNLLIPLNAFQGLVDFKVLNSPGIISAGLAITTSAILDPEVAAQWSALGGMGHFGEFTAGCGTTGALAFGQTGQRSVSPFNINNQPQVQGLGVAATACGDSDTFTLGKGETFYVWARLGVVNSGRGVTDAGNTFNVTIAPEYEELVQDELAQALVIASGENLDIRVASIPEPASWALMILGFGAAGAALRRRRGAVLTSL